MQPIKEESMRKSIRLCGIAGFAALVLLALTIAGAVMAGQRPYLPGRVLVDDRRINDDTGTAPQYAPAIAMHKNGPAVVAWPDGRNGATDIYFQLFNRRGQPFGTLGNVKVNDAAHAGSYLVCDVAMDGYGNFMVIWEGGTGGESHVYGQWYLANGKPLGGNIQIDETEGPAVSNGAAAAGMDSGGAVVVWTDRSGGTEGDVILRRIHQAGEANDVWYPVRSGSDSAQVGAAVAASPSGDIVVVWQEGSTGSARIMARRFDWDEGPIGAAFQVAPQSDPAALSCTAPAVTVAPNGGFAVFWMADYGGGEVRRQACLYDSTGQPTTGVFRVDEPGKFAFKGDLSVVNLNSQIYLFVWSGNESGDWNIYIRDCSAAGVFHSGSSAVNDLPGMQVGPDAAMDGTGNLLMVWYDNRNGDFDVYGEHLGSNIPMSLTAGAGFDGMVPLTWEHQFGESDPVRYLIYRGENLDAEPSLLATVDPSTRPLPDLMLDFIDTTAENGRSYYYGVRLETNGEGTMIAGPVAAQSEGRAVASSWCAANPVVDGTISAGEWDDATHVDISEPSGHGDVHLYVKNTSDSLYLAADDLNDVRIEAATTFGMLIDSNHDGRWPAAGPSNEGLLGFTPAGGGFWGYWGSYPNGLGGDALKPAASMASAISDASGRVQYEAAIPLADAPAGPSAGQTIGFAVYVSDPGNFYGTHYGYAGEWPAGALWEAAESLGELTLAAGPDAVDETVEHAHVAFQLGRNYPNPFNPSTVIPFTVKDPCRVTMKICDVLGREVAVPADGHYGPGTHSVRFNASGLSSGLYLVRMEAGGFTAMRKITVMK
jgi:hypothetical protein